MIGRYHILRRTTGAALLALLVGTPFLRIKGESAFRFDVPTLRLLFFGSEIWMADFFLILIALIALTFLTLFVTTVFGRIWCGWLCPQTVFLDAVASVSPAAEKSSGSRIAAGTVAALASGVTAASLIGYFVDPYEVPSLLKSGGTAAAVVQGAWLTLTVLLFLDARLLGRNFCATVCPYAKMQGVLFDARTLRVAYDTNREAECRGCEACVRACPVGIDVRKGLQMACIHCAECVDACTFRMKPRNRQSLIHYSWGAPGSGKAGLRINPLITGAITGVSLVFLLYLSATRMPFDMIVRLDYAGTEQPSARLPGTVYDLSFRNMTAKDITLDLSVVAPMRKASIEPETVLVKKGADLTRIKASVFVRPSIGELSDTVILTARSTTDSKSISKSVHILK
jgi:cytochrome c oxidase accessory protein FixG